MYPNGVSTSYSYDTLNRLSSMQSTCGAPATGCGAPGTAMAGYTYTLGPTGNRLSVAELSGRTVTYGYDDLYRLTSFSSNVAEFDDGPIDGHRKAGSGLWPDFLEFRRNAWRELGIAAE